MRYDRKYIHDRKTQYTTMKLHVLENQKGVNSMAHDVQKEKLRPWVKQPDPLRQERKKASPKILQYQIFESTRDSWMIKTIFPSVKLEVAEINL